MIDLPMTNLNPSQERYFALFPEILTPAPHPFFVIGPLPRDVRTMYYQETVVQGSGIYRPGRIEVTSHGLLLRNGAFLISPHMNLVEDSIRECTNYGELRADRPTSRVIEEPAVPLASPGHLIYGHWLVDFLPKLFLLQEAGFRLKELTYVLPANTPPFALELLTLMGISSDRVAMYQPYSETVTLADAVLPTLLRTGSRAHPAFSRAAQFLASRLSPPPTRAGEETGSRIFLSRAAAGRDHERALVNRGEIESFARSVGYAVIAPETLGFAEQIALFAGATRIIGEYGSAMHGSIFAPASARICALCANIRHPGFLQSGLCEVLHQKIAYVVGPTKQQGSTQQFSIALSDFRKALHLLESNEKVIDRPSVSVQILKSAVSRLWKGLRYTP